MSETNKEPQEVSEELQGILANTDKPLPFDDFVAKLEQVKKSNQHRYDTFQVSVATKNNAGVLVFSGVRKETNEELKTRLEKEDVKRKSLEEQELKEYIRLKKKFDKRVE